jgi:hypothetical protein
MINKKLLFLSLLLVLLPLLVCAQSNEIIDEILDTQKADWGKTTYLVLSAAELIGEDTGISEVITELEKQHWGITLKQSEDFITLGEYSYMLMKAFNLSGGIMYKIVPGPRYAARELDYLTFIDKNKSPYRNLSGEEVLRIMGRLLEWKEKQL